MALIAIKSLGKATINEIAEHANSRKDSSGKAVMKLRRQGLIEFAGVFVSQFGKARYWKVKGNKRYCSSCKKFTETATSVGACAECGKD